MRPGVLLRLGLRHAPGLVARWAVPLDARTLGELGEELAARALVRAGWRVIGRRLATPFGEVDLVGLADGDLVCVEVKATRAPPPGPHATRWRPGHRCRASQLRRQWRAAEALARRHGRSGRARVDLVEVFVQRGRPPVFVHHAGHRHPLGIRDG